MPSIRRVFNKFDFLASREKIFLNFQLSIFHFTFILHLVVKKLLPSGNISDIIK